MQRTNINYVSSYIILGISVLISLCSLCVSQPITQTNEAVQELNEFVSNESAVINCVKNYDVFNDGILEDMVEDYVWFNNMLQSEDINGKISLIWRDIDPQLSDSLDSIIIDQNYDNYEMYNINIDIITSIKNVLLSDSEYLMADNVRTDIAFHALRWLTDRFITRNGDLQAFLTNNNNITDRIQYSLIDILTTCKLKSSDMGTDNLGVDPREMCQAILNSNIHFAGELTFQIGVLVHFEGGIGIYGDWSKLADLQVYDTFGIGILLDIEVGLLFNYISFTKEYSGKDLLTANGKWTLGIQYFLGFSYSWIWNENRKTIGHEYSVAIGFGVQLLDYVWYIVHDKVGDPILSYNMSKLCQHLTYRPTPAPTPAGPPTIQPPSGEINLFDKDHKNWWTQISGHWSNITGIKPSITNTDNIGELDTIWIGDVVPSSMEWQNYRIDGSLTITDGNTDGDSSVGFIFGASSGATKAYYYGIYAGHLIFGEFNENETFNPIKLMPQSNIRINTKVQIAAQFSVVTSTNENFIQLYYNGVSMYNQKSLSSESSVSGSIGLRTIKMSGTFSQFSVTFNQTADGFI